MSDAPKPTLSRFFVVNQWLPPDSAPTAVLAGEIVDLLLEAQQTVVLISRARARQSRDPRLAALTHFVTDETESGALGIMGKLRAWPQFALAAYRTLRRELRAHDTLLVCSDPPLFYLVAVFAARGRGVRVIHWSQDVYPDIVEQHSRWPMITRFALAPLHWIRRLALRRIDTTVVLSESMHRRLVAAGARTQVIANWARDDRIQSRAVRDSNLRRAHFSDQDFVLAYSGNLGRVHEFETLLAAACALRTDSHIHFLIVGNGPRLTRLMQGVVAEKLKNFRFLPLQPESQLADSLAAGDAHFVSLQPQFEGLVLPSKLYSICAVGRAVVFCGDAHGEVATFIGTHNFGVAAAVHDAAALANAIRALAADAVMVERMGHNARHALDCAHARGSALAKWRSVLLPKATGSAPTQNDRA